MRVAYAVPWRPGPGREEGRDRARQIMTELLPDALVIECDSGHEWFNLSASRNLAVAKAEAAGADVVALVDADTYTQAQPLLCALREAQDGRIHLPYTDYECVTLDGQVTGRSGNSVGGAMVCTPAAYWSVGGHDAGFTSWGFEDAAFSRSAEIILGPLHRHPGVLRSFHHPRAWSSDTQEYRDGLARCLRYEAARTLDDLQAIRAAPR